MVGTRIRLEPMYLITATEATPVLRRQGGSEARSSELVAVSLLTGPSRQPRRRSVGVSGGRGSSSTRPALTTGSATSLALRCGALQRARPPRPVGSSRLRSYRLFVTSLGPAGLKQSGRPDLNRGPHRPERCALPGCATPRCPRHSSTRHAPPLTPPRTAPPLSAPAESTTHRQTPSAPDPPPASCGSAPRAAPPPARSSRPPRAPPSTRAPAPRRCTQRPPCPRRSAPARDSSTGLRGRCRSRPRAR